MKTLNTLLAVSAIALAGLVTTSVGDFGQVQAKAHAKKGKPGRCGAFYYYDKKQRLCINARLKK